MRGVYAGIVTGTKTFKDSSGSIQVRTVCVIDTDLVELPGNGLSAGAQVWLVGDLRTWRDRESGRVRHFFGEAPSVFRRDAADELTSLLDGREPLKPVGAL